MAHPLRASRPPSRGRHPQTGQAGSAAATGWPRGRVTAAHGFTLVEVLVALFIMAVLAGMAWKGVDALVRTRDGSKAASEATLRQGTVLAQWEQDLNQIQDSAVVPALAFDGAALRLTRRTPDGLQFVVWTRQGDQLWRWASPAVTRVDALNEVYARGLQWASISGEALAMLDGVSDMQVYYFRSNDNAWSNAQSTGDAATPAATPPAAPVNVLPDLAATALPRGVRLLLRLPAGTLTRDLVLRP